METLQQRVVQLPRNAGALAHSRVERHLETVMQLPDPDPVASPEQPQSTRRAERTEPGGLVVRWRDRELQHVALFVPHTAVVGGDDAEPVRAWTQIRILHVALVDDLSPVAVLPVQSVLEADLSGATKLSAV